MFKASTVLFAAAVSTAALMGTGTAAQAAPWVSFQDIAARVEVVAENRADIQVSVAPGKAALPAPIVRRNGDFWIVDGLLKHRIKGCGTYSSGFGMFHRDDAQRDSGPTAQVKGVGRVRAADMPLITVHVPLDAHVAADGAVFGRMGPARSVDFANVGCGDWSLSDVQGLLKVAISGSGDVKAGRVGEAHLAVSGSGDVELSAVDRQLSATVSGSGDIKVAHAHALSVQVAGSGDVEIGEIEGPVSASIAGSGDVTIQSGHAQEVQVAVAGSGDVTIHAQVGSVSAQVAGSGDITIDHASGPVSKSNIGSGDIRIGR